MSDKARDDARRPLRTMRVERMTGPVEVYTQQAEGIAWSSILEMVSADIPIATEALHSRLFGHPIVVDISLKYEPEHGGKLVIDTTQEHVEYRITIEEGD